MKARKIIAVISLIILGACDSTKIDPFQYVTVVTNDHVDFRLAYTSAAPYEVMNAKYTIDIKGEVVTVKFTDPKSFKRSKVEIEAKQIFSIPAEEEIRDLLNETTLLPNISDFTVCSRVSKDETYPLWLGLNLVYYVPKQTDKALFDVFVFANVFGNEDGIISIDSRTWTFSPSITRESPIVGEEIVVNESMAAHQISALELNSYTCSKH